MNNQVSIQNKAVTLISEVSFSDISELLNHFGLILNILKLELKTIPGSYWGESEAGLIKNDLYARTDTPLHSVLHEACHFICMDNKRRAQLDTDAGGDYDEENAVCYLQILLSDKLTQYNRQFMFDDMDNWGYTFRLGSAKRWFEEDAQDAKNWLILNGIIKQDGQVIFKLHLPD